MNKCIKISNGTSPRKKQNGNHCKENNKDKAVLNQIQSNKPTEDLNSNCGQNHQNTYDYNMTQNSNKSLIQHILTMFTNIKPQIEQYYKDKGIDNQYNKHAIHSDTRLNCLSIDELKHILNDDTASSPSKRQETYKKYFDFLFNTLGDIKMLCNKRIITTIKLNEDILDDDYNGNAGNIIQCDINDSQLKEKSHIIEPVGNPIQNIQSMLISSIYSDFYQEIIHNKSLKQLNSNQIEKNISLSSVVKENMALSNNSKDNQEYLHNKKSRRNDNTPKMLLTQQKNITIDINISNESTIKMIEEDNTENMNYYNNMSPMIKLPLSIKTKPEHKHTKSIQNTNIHSLKKGNCIII